MLMRFDPYRELDRMNEEISRSARPARMPMDAYRRGEAFFVHFDLPGADPTAIDLTVDQNTLTVTAERSWFPLEGDEVVISERPQGTFSRQLMLGDSLDTERIAAGYDQGVLTITIPVAERSKARKVNIAHGGASEPIETTSSTEDQTKRGLFHRH